MKAAAFQAALRWANVLTVVLFLGSALALILLAVPVKGVLLAAALLWLLLRRRRGPPTDHGSARPATPEDVPDLLPDRGEVVVGELAGAGPGKWAAARVVLDPDVPHATANRAFDRAFRKASPPPPLVHLNTSVHLSCYASTGAGKTWSLVLPFLARHPHSIVALDVKGELFLRSRLDRLRLNERVHCLDPWGMVGGADTFNPIQWIEEGSPDALDDCLELSAAMISKTGRENDPHWNSSAEVLLGAFIAATVAFASPENKTLPTAVALIGNEEGFRQTLAMMQASDAFCGGLSLLGHQLAGIHQKEMSSIKSVALRNAAFLSSPRVAANVRSSTVDLAGLRDGMTVYLVCPPTRLESHAGLFRLWMTSFVKAALRDGPGARGRVTFVADEAAALGPVPCFRTLLQLGRGYNARLHLYFQDRSQLTAAWPDGQEGTVLSNTTQVYAGVSDYATADALSRQLGDATIATRSGGTGTSRSYPAGQGGQGGSYSESSNANWSLMGRAMYRPDELLRQPRHRAFTFVPGRPPIVTTLVPFDSPRLRGQEAVGRRAAANAAFRLAAVAACAALMVVGVLKHERGVDGGQGKLGVPNPGQGVGRVQGAGGGGVTRTGERDLPGGRVRPGHQPGGGQRPGVAGRDAGGPGRGAAGRGARPGP